MMHPMRVEWSEPDQAKRLAANNKVTEDVKLIRNDRILGRLADLAGLERSLMLARGESEKFRIWARRYPDLEAEIVRFGTLLSIRYVPAQYGVTVGSMSGRATTHKLCDSKWVALVATQHGTQEMDPTRLRVMWPSAPGDPIAGVVTEQGAL
jgi:hypothetical protein